MLRLVGRLIRAVYLAINQFRHPNVAIMSWSFIDFMIVRVVEALICVPTFTAPSQISEYFEKTRKLVSSSTVKWKKLEGDFGVVKHGVYQIPRLDTQLATFLKNDPNFNAISLAHACQSDSSLLVEWVDVSDSKIPGKYVLFFHGGYYAFGSVGTHRHFACSLSKKLGATVISVEYRLSPEDPFPCALFDSISALVWCLKSFHISPANLILAGDSAGGGLAFSCAMFER
eukprot:Partr_v1_DN22956_c0_g1_i1_m42597 putative Carboxylesterase